MKVFVHGSAKEVRCVIDSKPVETSELNGQNTGNVSGYRAILFGLYKYPKATEVLSSNRMVVNQLNGEYRINQDHLKHLRDRVTKRLAQLGHTVSFTWVPKSSNPAARGSK